MMAITMCIWFEQFHNSLIVLFEIGSINLIYGIFTHGAENGFYHLALKAL